MIISLIEKRTMQKVSAAFVFKNPVHLLAFGFGSGLAPKAPGTFGTVVAVILYLLLAALPTLHYLLLILLSFLLGIYLCHKTAADLQTHDHPGIVWDEFVGYWISMIAAPAGWQWVVTGFVLFRLFDIAKPWPIGWLDRKLQGGFGIMLDDVLAGFYALVGMQLLARLIV
jgi:phosphatidylglycerophosphatase A